MYNLQSIVRDSDVSKWSTSLIKLSVTDVCRKFNIDIENDNRNKFFWNMHNKTCVIMNEEILNWIGYGSDKYSLQKQCLIRLLKKNKHVKYYEVADEKDPRKKYIVLDTIDFEGIMMQMRTQKVIELRELYALMRMIVTKYCEYEKWYERHSAELLRQQNSLLVESLNEMESLVFEVQEKGDERERQAEKRERQAEEERQRSEEERQRSEEERQRNEEERLLNKEERQKTKEERQKAEERERRAVKRNKPLTRVINTNIDREDIAPHVVPPPINPAKRHRLGL